MNEVTQIQLGKHQHVDAINQDTTIKIELSSSKETLMEYDVRAVVDVTQVFDEERQTTNIYRFHGEIEYFSLLNTLNPNYSVISDFFLRKYFDASNKSILSDFKFYLLKALPPSGTTLSDGTTESTGYTELIADIRYLKNYEVITELDNLDLFKAGYTKNIFEEQQYAFIIEKDINLTDVYDGLNFPITDIYLYAQYQPTNGTLETISEKTYNSTGGTNGTTPFTPTTLNVGDIVKGDIINYFKIDFKQELFNRQEYYINTPLNSGSLEWKYFPIIPMNIRTLSDDLSRVNISGNSIIDIESKPDYATKIDDDGNYVWRNLLDMGFINPLTGVGNNIPFINNKHYVFNNITVPIIPNLDDGVTASAFDEISFDANTLISSQPSSDLTNIGKPCL